MTGTITMYNVSDGPDREEEERLPEGQKWRALRTMPAAEVLNRWAGMYARLVMMLIPSNIPGFATGSIVHRIPHQILAERAGQGTGPLQEWHPDAEDLEYFVKGCEDAKWRELKIAERQHTAVGFNAVRKIVQRLKLTQDIHNCYLRHGWPDHFDKAACKVEVIELGQVLKAKQKEFTDANNADAGFSDDEEAHVETEGEKRESYGADGRKIISLVPWTRELSDKFKADEKRTEDEKKPAALSIN
jgi:hypothetical protein